MYLDELGPAQIRCKQGALYILTGGMKADKTKYFAGFFDRLSHTNIKWQVFKPKSDYRPELHEKFGGIPKDYIVSRTGLAIPATLIDEKGNLNDLEEKIDPQAEVYGFEEGHLYANPNKLKEIILELVYERNKAVVESSLDRDFKEEAFPITTDLMIHATKIDKLYGWCDVETCNESGILSQRIIDGKPAHYTDPVIMVGASEAYEVRCMRHHEVPGRPPFNSHK